MINEPLFPGLADDPDAEMDATVLAPLTGQAGHLRRDAFVNPSKIS